MRFHRDTGNELYLQGKEQGKLQTTEGFDLGIDG